MNDTDLEPDTGQTAVSACDAVFLGILRALEGRTMVPGQRLVETDLAAAYAVSRNSVREALQRLSSDGIVDLVRNKGAVIRMLSLRDTLDILEVAERISGLLARSAARAVAQGASVQALRRVVKSLSAVVRQDDPEAFAKCRRGFYRTLLELSQSRELQRLVPVLQMPIVYAQYALPNLTQLRLGDYRAIAAAVLEGDEDAADLAAMAHVANVRAAILAASGRGAP